MGLHPDHPKTFHPEGDEGTAKIPAPGGKADGYSPVQSLSGSNTAYPF